LERRVTALAVVSALALVAAGALALTRPDPPASPKPPPAPSEIRLRDGPRYAILGPDGLRLGRDGVVTELGHDALTVRRGKRAIELAVEEAASRLTLIGASGQVAAKLTDDADGVKLELRDKSGAVFLTASSGVGAIRVFGKFDEEGSLTAGVADKPVVYLESRDGTLSILRAGEPMRFTPVETDAAGEPKRGDP
jgi:hypothetical protein